MKGFYKRFLRVDLSERTTHVEEIPDEVAARYLGGKGLSAYLLLNHSPAGADPLGPENPFIIGLGPASGTPLAPASRYGVYCKSPLTGIFAESYSGGHVTPHMRRTGYDAIMLEGTADEPVWLEISDQATRFHDAGELWGQETYATEDALKQAVPAGRPIVVGPAGENLVHFALINNDYWRHAGRCGTGAVLGSKKVKGIVFHGQSTPKLHDPQRVAAYDQALRARAKDDPGVATYRRYGTSALVALANRAGAFPSYYWSRGQVPHWEAISGDTLVREFQPRPQACYRCFMACGNLVTLKDGPYAGLKLEGPEYETLFAFGGLCAVDNLPAILYLNDLCDRLGLDTISGGNLAALAIEACRRGALDLGLDYGDVDGIANLLRRVARREDQVGELFARGTLAAGRELGLEELVIHVKGLEPPGYEPRALKGMGLAFAVSDRGACHLRATVYKAEYSGLADPQQVEGKAELVLDFEDRHTLFDTLIFCRFYRDLIPWEDLETVIHALTGLEADKAQLQAISADIAGLIRQYNLREGMTPADDTLPPRLLAEPLEPGGQRLTEAELVRMLEDYYKLRGWAK